MEPRGHPATGISDKLYRRTISGSASSAGALTRVTWLTFRLTYSSWAHDKGVPGKAQIMSHAKVDTTINVYTQVLDGAVRSASDRVGSELFMIVHNRNAAVALTD